MRFAITATDRYIAVFQSLLERGWTPVKVFTTEVDGRIHRNTAVIELSQRHKLDLQLSRLCEQDLRQLAERGCEALIVASYQWRIADWRPYLRYAVNFHPSPLPRGRGPYPAPAAILEQADSWGVSCHKLDQQFDAGDVLRSVEFPLSAQEDHDSLDLKIQMAARRLAGEVADRFAEYWDGAIPQSGGTYLPMWTEEDRRLDFSQGVEQILRRLRAFGPLECLAYVNRIKLFVRRAIGWLEPHRVPVGTVVYVNSLATVIAAADGFIGLIEWSLLAPDAVTGTPHRRP